MGYLLDIADEVSQQRAKEPTIGPLADFASQVPGVPVIRITAYETEDVNGDAAWLHRLRELLKDHPGSNRVVLTIRTLDGRKVLAEWRALSSPGLRRGIAMLVRQRAFSLGIVFRKSSLSCIQCSSTDPGYDVHGRTACFTCRRGQFL